MIDRVQSSRTRHDESTNEPEATPRGTASRSAEDVSHVLARFSDVGAQLATIDAASPLDAAAVRDLNAGARLDALRDRFSGPYQVDGQTVSAPPMFRMNGGANQAHVASHKPELAAICARAGIDFYACTAGHPTPEQLVRVTQALVDAGKLPPPPGAAADRIKTMQWEWGIGVDCAGYTYRAAMAASGASAVALGLLPLGTEGFRALDANKQFKKIDPTLARPGDVITLDPLPPEKVGHNVIVRSHSMKGTLHTYEVDSSWGAGSDGDVKGGFRRDTWTYDESTRLWSWTNTHVSPPVTDFSTEGPSGERFHGCYRPKVGK